MIKIRNQDLEEKSEKSKRKRWMILEKDEFTKEQNFLYKRALFGLGVYSHEEIIMMHVDKKKRITKVSARAQNILNLWKQTITIAMTNAFFKKYFSNSSLIKILVEKFTDIEDPKVINTIDFKDLGITKKHIVNKLIKEGVLPNDFYDLKKETHEKLPRLRQQTDSIPVPTKQKVLQCLRKTI